MPVVHLKRENNMDIEAVLGNVDNKETTGTASSRTSRQHQQLHSKHHIRNQDSMNVQK